MQRPYTRQLSRWQLSAIHLRQPSHDVALGQKTAFYGEAASRAATRHSGRAGAAHGAAAMLGISLPMSITARHFRKAGTRFVIVRQTSGELVEACFGLKYSKNSLLFSR